MRDVMSMRGKHLSGAAVVGIAYAMAVASFGACRPRGDGAPTASAGAAVSASEASAGGEPDADAGTDAASGDDGPHFLQVPSATDATRASGMAVEARSMRGQHVDFAYPRVVFGEPAVTRSVDAAIDVRLRRERARYLKDRAEVDACRRSQTDQEGCSYALGCGVMSASERLVSVLCSGTADFHGAHPSKTAFAINLALRTHAVMPLELAQIFQAGAPVSKIVERLGHGRLQRQLGPDSSDELIDGALAKPDFALAADGLHLVYADFPFVIGPLEVVVSWADVPQLDRAGPAAGVTAR